MERADGAKATQDGQAREPAPATDGGAAPSMLSGANTALGGAVVQRKIARRLLQRKTEGQASPTGGADGDGSAQAQVGKPRDPVWVEFTPQGTWDGQAVLAALRSQCDVTPELEAAIVAGPVATAKVCVALRDRVEATGDPAHAEETRAIANSLRSRINELIHGTSQSPLQYRQLAEVAGWLVRFPASQGEAAPATEKPAGPEAKEDRGAFAASYYTRGKLLANSMDSSKGDDYEQFKAHQGKIEATSESGTPEQRAKNPMLQKVLVELSGDDLLEIYERNKTPPKNQDPVAWKAMNPKIAAEVPRINAAFRIMKLDTSGGQAHYLANAYMESGQLAFMTETAQAGGDQAFREDGNAKVDKSWLDDAKDNDHIDKQAGNNLTQVTGYMPGESINKAGTAKEDHWDQSFLGRGPIQVTHDWGYLQTIAVMEVRLDELEALPKDSPERQDIPLLAEAIREIKKDPSQAANRKYTYLFSAASRKRRMQKKDGSYGSRLDAQVANSANPAIAGMGDHSQVPESAAAKARIFGNALTVINRNNAKAKAEQQPAP